MAKIPQNGIWNQPNSSDRFGSISASKNIDLDERGYLKLSPRTVLLMSEERVANHVVPTAYGFNAITSNEGTNFNFVTTGEEFTGDLTSRLIDLAEDTGTTPSTTAVSHGVFFNAKWLGTDNTDVFERTPSGAEDAGWTVKISSGAGGDPLTSGKRHVMAIFESKNSLCITNGNKVNQYASGYSNDTDGHLSLPIGFDAVKIVYSKDKMAVLALPAATGLTLGTEAYIFIWDGKSTVANQGFPIGSYGGVGLHAYKGSFIVITMDGQVKFYTGGGLQTIAVLPFRNTNTKLRKDASVQNFGSNLTTDGETIYANLTNDLDLRGAKGERQTSRSPSGVWALGEGGNFYHRLSPSMSQATVATVTSGNANTSTDILTATIAGTRDSGSYVIPATGNVARYTDSGNDDIGGLELYKDYFIIKQSDTTFKLATTKENALSNIAIDITSQSANSSFFYLFDLTDYGQTYFTTSGAISSFLDLNPFRDRFIIGGKAYNTSLSEKGVTCMTVPGLENRGYIVTPKIFSGGVTDTNRKLVVKYRPMKSTDSIVVKKKVRDVLGLPVSSPQDTFSNSEGEWSAANEFFTGSDLSEAKTYIDAGGALECEITAGLGAGQMSQVKSITTSGNNHIVFLDDDVIGYTTGSKCYFIIDNWEVLTTITDDTKGYLEIPVGKVHKWTQFKLEMRGSDIIIEELDYISSPHKPAR